MNYYIGVDSGGTKTKFCVINNLKEEVLVLEDTTGHVFQVGQAGLEKLLIDNIIKIKSKLNIEDEAIKHITLCLPGYGETVNDDKIIHDACRNTLNQFNYKVFNDSFAGWAGSLGCQPGINIVSGTGSIAIMVDEKFEIHRCGGYGPLFGDQGSAYWIAIKGLEIFSKQEDGRIEKTELYYKFIEKLELTKENNIVNYIYNTLDSKRDLIASLAIIIDELAIDGDIYAIDILENAGFELANHINFFQNKSKTNTLCTYSGSTFKSKILFNTFKNNLAEGVIWLNRFIVLIMVLHFLVLYRRKMKVISLNSAIDTNYTIENFEIGKVNRISKVESYPGGKAINVSKVLHCLNCSHEVHGFYGGYNGLKFIELLEKKNIKHQLTKCSSETRVCTNIISSNSTELLEKGPYISAEELEMFENSLLDKIIENEYIVLSGSLPINIESIYYKNLIEKLNKYTNNIILDTSTLTKDIIMQMQIKALKINSDEFSNIYNTRDIVTEIKNIDVEIVFITMGKEGSIVKYNDEIYKVSVPHVDVVSAVGSGDATTAGLVYALTNNYDIINTMKFSCACGCANTLEKESGFIDLKRLEEFVENIKIVKVS